MTTINEISIKVFSWNFGKLNSNKLECIMKNVFDNTDASNTIYVIGLQEISGSSSLREINQYFESNKPASHTMKHGTKSSSMFTKFELATFVIYPIDINLPYITFNHKTIPSNDSFGANIVDTKGYLWADFNLNGINYTAVNIHLPFQNEEFSLKNFKLLKETFKDKKNVIIFGDYNTRSKFDDTCINSDNCNVDFEKNAKYSTDDVSTKMNTCSEPSNDIVDCSDIKENLIKYDYLNESKEFNEYKEDKITFLPTYKINDENGAYSLVKNHKYRLPGYADRILVRGPNLTIVPGSYKKIDCTGNDHFPIMLSIKLNNMRTWEEYVGGKINSIRVNRYKSTNKNRKHKNKSIRKKSIRKNNMKRAYKNVDNAYKELSGSSFKNAIKSLKADLKLKYTNKISKTRNKSL